MFKFYLEHNGKVRDINSFKKYLEIWLMKQGVGYRGGVIIICKHFDAKYGYR